MEGKYLLLLILMLLYIGLVKWFSLLGDRREIGHRRLFWISLLLTPAMGLAFLLSSQERKVHFYTEEGFKCERCSFVFSEKLPACPFCLKEGIRSELKPVRKFMT
ncbi:MAG: hypothetical protein JW861_14050 [Bacteroidales bacterium]|nr:hypothetical protein [Bacteroidales bacterium]